MMPITPMVKHLIIINVIFYIGSNFLVKNISYDLFALYFPLTDNFHFWQILTHMFMHAKVEDMFTHIIFNMLGLYMFGSALEHFWGGKKFLFFYISCGLGSALVHTGVNYYHFKEGLNTLLSNGFSKVEILQLLNEGKIDTRWQELLTVTEKSFLSIGNSVSFSSTYTHFSLKIWIRYPLNFVLSKF
jgi:hypothetical protein